MSRANLTKFRLDLPKNTSLELIYKTPNEKAVWNVLAMLKDIKQYGFEGDDTNLDLLENELSYYERKLPIQRQDAVENGQIIPSFRFFTDNCEICIHKHEGKFHNLYDEACAYILRHPLDGSDSYVDEIDNRLIYKANNDNNLERIDIESALRFSVKHKFNSNLDLARQTYQAESRKPFVTPKGPK